MNSQPDFKTLSLYIGSEVRSAEGTMTYKLVGIVQGGPCYAPKREYTPLFQDEHGNAIELTDWKLCLRSLKSMTDQEMDDVWLMHEPLSVLTMENEKTRRKVVLCPQRHQYLLSRGFDLFGLIEQGHAIKKA